MMDNDRMKSNLKPMDFSNRTPLRTPNHLHNTGEFTTSQKGKYDTAHRQLSNTLNMYANPPALSESFANQKEVYDNQVKVRVKSHDREEYHLLLNIKIAMVNPAQSHVQILHIELTDESNHLFLYTLDLSETDFFALKNEQQLLVDFHAFPTKFVEMLELCLNSSNASGNVNFLCALNIKNTGEAYFNIVEANQFRALTHLSLKFREANDQTVKQYLAGRLANERATTEQLRQKVEGLEDALAMRGTELDAMQSEYKKLQADKENKIEEIRNMEGKRMNDMQRMALEKETELKNEHDRDRRDLIMQYEKRIRELDEKVGSLSAVNADLLNTKIELESRQRELTGNLKAFEKENAVLQSEILSRRTENTELSEVRFSNEKKVAELGAKIENLENQMRNKEELAKKSNELLETTNRQKAILEENIVDYKKQIEKLEAKVTQSCDEVTKGNAMIEKLQGEITAQKQKIKEWSAVAKDQDAEIGEYRDRIEKMTKEMNELRMESDSKQNRIREHEINIENLKNQLVESQKLIESNNSMIQWLNSQLNSANRPGAPRPTTSMTSSKYGPVSPHRQYDDNVGMSSSYKYTSTLPPEKIAKYQTDDYNPSYTAGSFGLKNATAGYGYNERSVTKNGSDFDNYLGAGNLNKENFDLTNKSDYRNPGTTGMAATRSPYSTTPIKETGKPDFGGTMSGTRPIQPIRYEAKK